MKTVNLDLLQAIVAFADSGSCKGAAQIVNRSQSAISIKLKKLEDDLGTSLFTRTGRKISLNEKGKDTVSDARRILRISNELVEKATSRELTGTIRLGLPDDYISLLSNFLSRFANEFPNVNLILHCAPTAELKPMLQRGDLDLSILSSETDTKEGLVLQRQPVHWIGSRISAVHTRRPLPLALFPDGCIFRKWALNALINLECEYKIVCTSPNMAALQAVVQAGLAVSAFPKADIPPNSRILSAGDGFPQLSDVTIMLCVSPSVRDDRQSALARGLRDMMLKTI